MEPVEPPRSDENRRALLEGVRRHDPASLEAFFEEHVDGIYDLAYRLLGEPAPAEDAAQEVFLRVHRAAASLDPDRDPGPWLRKVTRNVCRDVWRSPAYRFAQRSVPLDPDPPQARVLAASPENPEEIAVTGERAQMVQAAIGRLPEELREVVVLHDYSGLRHNEIAEIVDASHAAVRKRYSRAIARLADMLKGVLE